MTTTVMTSMCNGITCTVYAVALPSGSYAVIAAEISMGQVLIFLALFAILCSLLVLVVKSWLHS